MPPAEPRAGLPPFATAATAPFLAASSGQRLGELARKSDMKSESSCANCATGAQQSRKICAKVVHNCAGEKSAPDLRCRFAPEIQCKPLVINSLRNVRQLSPLESYSFEKRESFSGALKAQAPRTCLASGDDSGAFPWVGPAFASIRLASSLRRPRAKPASATTKSGPIRRPIRSSRKAGLRPS